MRRGHFENAHWSDSQKRSCPARPFSSDARIHLYTGLKPPCGQHRPIRVLLLSGAAQRSEARINTSFLTPPLASQGLSPPATMRRGWRVFLGAAAVLLTLCVLAPGEASIAAIGCCVGRRDCGRSRKRGAGVSVTHLWCWCGPRLVAVLQCAPMLRRRPSNQWPGEAEGASDNVSDQGRIDTRLEHPGQSENGKC